MQINGELPVSKLEGRNGFLVIWDKKLCECVGHGQHWSIFTAVLYLKGRRQLRSSGPFIGYINWRSQYFSREIPGPKEEVHKLKTLKGGSENMAYQRKMERSELI